MDSSLDRSAIITGYLKPALVEIANPSEKMLIPVLDDAKSKEENKLVIHGVEIEVRYLQRTNM